MTSADADVLRDLRRSVTLVRASGVTHEAVDLADAFPFSKKSLGLQKFFGCPTIVGSYLHVIAQQVKRFLHSFKFLLVGLLLLQLGSWLTVRQSACGQLTVCCGVGHREVKEC